MSAQAAETVNTKAAHRRIAGRLVIATHNPGKMREMRELLSPFGIDAVSAGEMNLAEPDETGNSFQANARIKALAMVPAASLGLLAEPRYLQTVQNLPPTLVANAIAVQEANREYQERALGRDGLRRMYIGTLTLSLFLSVFGAVLLAVVLGNQLARPLLLLAAGVREVAAGDLSPKPALQGKDELGGLTRDFAQMIGARLAPVVGGAQRLHQGRADGGNGRRLRALPAGAAPRGFRHRPSYCGPSPPSGGTQSMIWYGSMMSQVLQWTQFDALMCSFFVPSPASTIS